MALDVTCWPLVGSAFRSEVHPAARHRSLSVVTAPISVAAMNGPGLDQSGGTPRNFRQFLRPKTVIAMESAFTYVDPHCVSALPPFQRSASDSKQFARPTGTQRDTCGAPVGIFHRKPPLHGHNARLDALTDRRVMSAAISCPVRPRQPMRRGLSSAAGSTISGLEPSAERHTTH